MSQDKLPKSLNNLKHQRNFSKPNSRKRLNFLASKFRAPSWRQLFRLSTLRLSKPVPSFRPPLRLCPSTTESVRYPTSPLHLCHPTRTTQVTKTTTSSYITTKRLSAIINHHIRITICLVHLIIAFLNHLASHPSSNIRWWYLTADSLEIIWTSISIARRLIQTPSQQHARRFLHLLCLSILIHFRHFYIYYV